MNVKTNRKIQTAYVMVRTAVVLPWTAFMAAVAVFCAPVVIALSFAISEDFSDFAENVAEFYGEHMYAFTGLESVIDGWRSLFREAE